MANPPTQHYVDPSIAANSGTGTIGDPYGDLQYALNTITQDTADGDQINIKAGTAEFLLGITLSMASYGVANVNYPLYFRGYTAVKNDGGVAAINCGGIQVLNNSGSSIHWIDVEIHDGPAAGYLVELASYSIMARCYIHDCDASGVQAGGSSAVMGCRFEDIDTDGIWCNSGGVGVIYCYFKNGAKDFRYCVALDKNQPSILNNIMSISGASSGIWWRSDGYAAIIDGNTILSAGGTGKGITSVSNALRGASLVNNYIEGFSGVGGIGIDLATTSMGSGVRGHNVVYNNATNTNFANEHLLPLGIDPEILTASGLAKSGSDTFANRFEYFKAVAEGGMLDGGMEAGGYPDN